MFFSFSDTFTEHTTYSLSSPSAFYLTRGLRRSMDTCNFPERLALDLESADSVFAAKRLSAGVPRASRAALAAAIAEPKRMQDPSSDKENREPCALSPALPFPRSPAARTRAHCYSLSEDRACPRSLSLKGEMPGGRAKHMSLLSREDALACLRPTSAVGFRGHASNAAAALSDGTESMPFVPSSSSASTRDCDSNSLDSFEIPNISLVSPRSVRVEQQHRQLQHQKKLLLLQQQLQDADDSQYFPPRYAQSLRTGGDDNDSIFSDTTSESSFECTVPSSIRNRHQSVMTTATSVTSGCRSSTQSHTLSAMGPSSPQPHSLTESATLERHVDFDLDEDDTQFHADAHRSTPFSSTGRSVHVPNHPPQSSWIDFDEEEEEENEEEDVDSKGSMQPAFSSKTDPAPSPLLPLSPWRPSSAMGRLNRDQSDHSEQKEWIKRKRLSQSSVTSAPVLPRRSSFSRLQGSAMLSDLHQQTQQHQRALQNSTRSDASAPFGVFTAGDALQADPIHLRDDLDISPMSTSPGPAIVINDIDTDGLQQNRIRMLSDRTQYSGRCTPLPTMERQFDTDDDEENDGELEDEKFDTFEESYDYVEGQDKIMMATVIPFSKQHPRSLRSHCSQPSDAASLSIVPASPSRRFSARDVSDVSALDAEETSSNLQSWVQHTSQMHHQFAPSHEMHDDDSHAMQETQNHLLKISVPHNPSSFSRRSQVHTPVTAVPLPREVIDTLRVSVSCFPDTMLSLSSFTIQTIRIYSRKVRRDNCSDADSAHRLLLSPTAPGLCSTNSPLSDSPLATSFCHGTTLGRANSSASTAKTSSTSSSHPQSHARRFWRLPKRLVTSRTAPNVSPLTGASPPPTPWTANAQNARAGEGKPASPCDSEQDKAGGSCFKRIFPTGSAYLCDALYAHIIAFNYISLLCPVVPVKRPTSHHGSRPRPLSAAGAELAQGQNRQRIRVYAGSDVAVQPSCHWLLEESEESSSPSPEPASPAEEPLYPPVNSCHLSRGGPEDVRCVSRKAALLLGIEDPMAYGPVHLKAPPSRGVASLAQRYKSFRLRRKGADEPAGVLVKSRPMASATPMRSSSMGKSTLAEPLNDIEEGHGEGPTPAAAAASTAVADAAMRDLQSGLHSCISQLVSTLKLTTGQMGNTLLNSEAARDIDPLFLRTLCELVRSQEEQI